MAVNSSNNSATTMALLQKMNDDKMPNLAHLPEKSIQEQKDQLSRMTVLSDARKKLYGNLMNTYGLMNNEVSSRNKDLTDKETLVRAYEKQIGKYKEKIHEKSDLDTNNLRLTKINTYYTQKYKAYFKLFQKIVVLCIMLIFIAVLRQRYIINSRLANVLATLVIAIGTFIIIPTILDLSARNNMVFDEYDFALDPTKRDDQSINPPQTKRQLWWEQLKKVGAWGGGKADDAVAAAQRAAGTMSGECVGPSCCTPSGLQYDSTTNSCKVEGYQNMKIAPLAYGEIGAETPQLIVPPNYKVYRG